MQQPISRFLSASGATYIDKAAEYLQERGLSVIDDKIAIIPYASVNYGHYTKDAEGNPIPLILEGWAYGLRDYNQDLREHQYLLRICNHPRGKVYQKFGRSEREIELPKFIQTTKTPIVHYTARFNEFHAAPVVMIHEKISSAELAKKSLNIPSVAVSGCIGWGKGGSLHKELQLLVSSLARGTSVVVCFDGDLVGNPNIALSASQLKGAISTLRPDLKIVFPLVPENNIGVGWDDWGVSIGLDNLSQQWAELLHSDGVEVVDVLPVGYLCAHFGVSTKIIKDAVFIQHSLDNYMRLWNFDRWRGYIKDISGDIYCGDGPSLPASELANHYRRWLERSVYPQDSAGVVDKNVEKTLRSCITPQSVALSRLQATQLVSFEEAKEAAERCLTKGLMVVGPMSFEHTIETFMLMCRDMALLWTMDPAVDVQWALALIGPSGCGKSNFFKSFLNGLRTLDYTPRVSLLAKDGSKASMDEWTRIVRDSLVAVMDEYNPEASRARQLEQQLFTLSCTRSLEGRPLYIEELCTQIRHAAIVLTTTDNNREYIRSAKGDGERRFITFEVEGVWERDGMITSDRTVIEECGLTLLRWAAQGAVGVAGDATKHSVHTSGDYLSVPNVYGRIVKMTLLAGWLEDFGNANTLAGEVRFSTVMIADSLTEGRGLSHSEKGDLRKLLMECGAQYRAKDSKTGVGRTRVVGNTVDAAFVVPKDQWKGLLAVMRGKLRGAG